MLMSSGGDISTMIKLIVSIDVELHLISRTDALRYPAPSAFVAGDELVLTLNAGPRLSSVEAKTSWRYRVPA